MPPFISGPARYPCSALSRWNHQKTSARAVSPSSNLPSGSTAPVIATSTSGPTRETSASRPSAVNLDGDGSLDGGVGVIPLENEVLVAEGEQVLHCRVEPQPREGAGRSL